MNHNEINIEDLSERLTTLQIKKKMKEEEQEQVVSEIHNLLDKIKPEDIEQLQKISPKVSVLRGLSIDDVIANKDNIQKTLYTIMSELYTFLDNRLKEFEEMI